MSNPPTVEPIPPAPPAPPAAQQPVEAHEIPVPDAPSTTIPTAPLDNPEAQTQAPTASIDPNKPSTESAPTALPTNPATHPEEQKEAIKEEHPQVIKREVEKTKAEERDLKGEKPQGTVVAGLEDDRLWAMLRRFDVVSAFSFFPIWLLQNYDMNWEGADYAFSSKLPMSCTLLITFPLQSLTFVPLHFRTSPPTQMCSVLTSSVVLPP